MPDVCLHLNIRAADEIQANYSSPGYLPFACMRADPARVGELLRRLNSHSQRFRAGGQACAKADYSP